MFEMTVAQKNGNYELVHSLCHGLYFESAAMILTLITVGKLLETYSKGKTTICTDRNKDNQKRIYGSGQAVQCQTGYRPAGDQFILRACTNGLIQDNQ